MKTRRATSLLLIISSLAWLNVPATTTPIQGAIHTTDDWIRCWVVNVSADGKKIAGISCPRLDQPGVNRKGLRLARLDGIRKARGVQFLFHRSGRCLTAFSEADYDREKFIRQPAMDCHDGPLYSALRVLPKPLPPKK